MLTTSRTVIHPGLSRWSHTRPWSQHGPSITVPLRVRVPRYSAVITKCIGCAAWLSLGGLIGSVAGNEVASFYSQRTQHIAMQSLETWQRASHDVGVALNSRDPVVIKYSGGSKAKAVANQEALQAYLTELIPAMAPSPNVAHIPVECPVCVDTTQPVKKWTGYYAKAKHCLRPHVKYKWSSNAHRKKAGIITLTEEHIATLQRNFDILMWYRNELDTQADDQQRPGADEFRRFLDFFVADLLKSLPNSPRISMSTGKVAADEWALDEQLLIEQLVMAYRYLIAKYQIYPEYEQFGPADRELLTSMMKIAFLMGAHMNPQWLETMEVNLKAVGQKSRWKKPMAEALGILEAKSKVHTNSLAIATDGQRTYETPFVIAIPAPRPPDEIQQPPQPEEVQRIEIIVRPTR